MAATWQQVHDLQRRVQIDAAMLEVVRLGASPMTVAVLAYECGLTEHDIRQLLTVLEDAA